MRAPVKQSAFLACAALFCAVFELRAEPLALLDTAHQLLLVVTPDWDTVRGTLQRFERGAHTESWRPVGAAGMIVVGKNGTAWDPLASQPIKGPVKAEGDGRSPAGVFSLGKAFGYAAASGAGWLKLPYLTVTEGVECVDDPTSTVYNQIVDRRAIKTPDWNSSEKMREVGEAYRWGVVVNYNTPAVAKRGSCIFLHIGGDQGKGTAGCTAMAPEFLREVMAWVDPDKAPVLVQLPRAAYDALKPAWSLP
jgi:D-alanyl-D-alanine dipeptidase